MAVGLEQFVKSLEDSGIITPSKLRAVREKLPSEKQEDAQELARELVRLQKLTKFQAQEAYQGKAKNLVLGNYVILDKIGAGGMGQVYKAEHRRMHRTVAIKMLPSSMTKDAAAIARFEREVTAAAKLRHTNIVAADDADQARGVHFLVMEYVEGNDLSALVKKNGPFPLDKAVNYVLQAARGLEYAHSEGVVHRDIKPANLLLDKKGTVKILDMGLARLESGIGGDAATAAELTTSGQIMGTVDYMSPEQAFNTKQADARADIYSLGCTLFYLLTGKPLYGGETIMEKLLAHREKPIPTLVDAGTAVPQEVDAIYQRMVAKKVEDRYQSMTDVIADLQGCGLGSGSTVTGKTLSSTGAADSNSNLTILKDAAPGRTIQRTVTKPVKQPHATASKGSNTKKFALMGAALLAVLLAAGIVVSLRNSGTLIVEIDQPDAAVQVLDAEGKVEVSQGGGAGKVTISVAPGKHRLRVEKDGFAVFDQDFEMEKGGKKEISARLVAAQPWNTLAFQAWTKEVSSLIPQQQLDAVVQKLHALNPDLKLKYRPSFSSESGRVTELTIRGASGLNDLSALRALTGLKTVSLSNSYSFTDLSPLEGLSLASLDLSLTKCSGLSPLKGMPLETLYLPSEVNDLSPLQGMPLKTLYMFGIKTTDLSPLQGMKLNRLEFDLCAFSDLSPLAGAPLTTLKCSRSPVKDLSPLSGMPLINLDCNLSPVSDLLPLENCPALATLNVKGTKVTPAGVAAFQAKFPNCYIEWDDPTKATSSPTPAGAAAAASPLFMHDPAFPQWLARVQAMPAAEQVKAVSAKLVELNPGFDGKVTGVGTAIEPKIANNVVTELGFLTDDVADISPVRALAGLKSLSCNGKGKGKLTDLAPLKGLPITNLYMPFNRQFADLSPLQSMDLVFLNCSHSEVTDLSPLKDCKNLTALHISQTKVTATSVAALRQAIPNCNIDWSEPAKPAAGLPAPVGPTVPIANPRATTDSTAQLFMHAPAFPQWMKDVQDMPAVEQIKAVSAKLVELNPGFDGKLTEVDGKGTPTITGGAVTEVKFDANSVTDLTPLRALAGLKSLNCTSSGAEGKLADLSPLRGMQLTRLHFHNTKVADLTPLEGMPLTGLSFSSTRVSSLTPLRGMPLTSLNINGTRVTYLSPLVGMKLTKLVCSHTKVSNLSPLEGMPLSELDCLNTGVIDLTPLHKCAMLTSLDLTKTKVSAASVAALKKAVPDCDVEWDDPAKAQQK